MPQSLKLSLGALFYLITALLMAAYFMSNRQLPLISTLGFESANIFVLIFAPLLAMSAVLCPTKTAYKNFSGALNYNLVGAGLIYFSFCGLALFNQSFVESCSPGQGFFNFFLVSLPPVLLNVALASLIASWFKKTSAKVFAIFLLYILYISSIVFYWWQEPNFRILTHGLVLIDSDLLNGASINTATMSFRLATLCICFSIIFIGNIFTSKARAFFSATENKKINLSMLALPLLMVLAFYFHNFGLNNVGESRQDLENNYTLRLEENNLVFLADPNKLSKTQVQDLLEEALFYQHKIGKVLKPLAKAPIYIWLHHSDEAKFQYTGARNVHFALPKHREIHLSYSEVPHPVLGHELAHIYVGEHTKTIHGLPGALGFVPNLALTEGLAMLLSPELAIDNDLTMQEQAKALYQAGLKINLDDLFSLNPLKFSALNTQASYIFAGAFLEFLALPSEQIIKLSNAGDLQAFFATEADKNQAFSAFTRELEKPVVGYAILWAEQNFLQGSILATNCKDPKQHEKKVFAQHLLNLDAAKAYASIKAFTKPQVLKMLQAGQRILLSQNHFEQALLLANAYLGLTNAEDPQINEIYLNQFDALINLNHPNILGLNNLTNIDINFLDRPSKRQFFISSNLKNNDLLSDEALNLLKMVFAKNGDILSRSMALGKNTINPSRVSDPATLFSLYMQARILIKEKHHERALESINILSAQPKLCPPVLWEEILLMKARSLHYLEKFKEAELAYKALADTNTCAAYATIAQNNLEKINFLLKRVN